MRMGLIHELSRNSFQIDLKLQDGEFRTQLWTPTHALDKAVLVKFWPPFLSQTTTKSPNYLLHSGNAATPLK